MLGKLAALTFTGWRQQISILSNQKKGFATPLQTLIDGRLPFLYSAKLRHGLISHDWKNRQSQKKFVISAF